MHFKGDKLAELYIYDFQKEIFLIIFHKNGYQASS